MGTNETAPVLFARDFAAALINLGAPAAELRTRLVSTIELLERAAAGPQFVNLERCELQRWVTELHGIVSEVDGIEALAAVGRELAGADVAVALTAQIGSMN